MVLGGLGNVLSLAPSMIAACGKMKNKGAEEKNKKGERGRKKRKYLYKTKIS